MTIQVPHGFRLASVSCGIKRDASRPDFTMIHCPRGATAAGVYTQNLVFAAPVAYDRARTPSADIRVLAINSGNANACTGERGMRDAAAMANYAAAACGAQADQALVMSTGIIGEFLPMEKIAAGAKAAAAQLGDDEQAFLAAARGIMTTDKFHKIAARTIELSGTPIRLAGMCKGAGMIGPNMATMLAIVLTDARLSPAAAQTALREATDSSFNCISVEGHMSTNDTLVLLASGAADGPELTGADLAAFQRALNELCVELCRQIPDDGEGSSHLITIDVRGCRTREEARRIAKTIAESALVKTAICGADPNWGRIVSAAGYAGVIFNPAKLDLHINGLSLYQQGRPVEFDANTVSSSIKDNRECRIELTLAEGTAHCRFWTSDLGHEYIRINADYHT
ncbi:MAG: bifunctional glutamate N-acetyltransferase/amino-acid acetyltransferase ArgJ [Pirellulales bacterium]